MKAGIVQQASDLISGGDTHGRQSVSKQANGSVVHEHTAKQDRRAGYDPGMAERGLSGARQGCSFRQRQ
eukprot:760333-Hanusia_phi.AAC.2